MSSLDAEFQQPIKDSVLTLGYRQILIFPVLCEPVNRDLSLYKCLYMYKQPMEDFSPSSIFVWVANGLPDTYGSSQLITTR